MLGLLVSTTGAALAVVGMFFVVRRATDLLGRSAAPRVDELVTVLCAVVALVIAIWFVVALLVSLGAHLPGIAGVRARRVADQMAPTSVRRLAAIVAGAVAVGTLVPTDATGGAALPDPSLRATVTSPALRATDPPGPRRPPESPGPVADTPPLDTPAPGFVPTRPTVRPQPDPRLLASARPGTGSEREVVVHRGDTLWGIVHQHLGSDATDAEVAQAWPHWHEANRTVIGPDPDLILPGQILHPPAPIPHHAPTTEDVR